MNGRGSRLEGGVEVERKGKNWRPGCWCGESSGRKAFGGEGESGRGGVEIGRSRAGNGSPGTGFDRGVVDVYFKVDSGGRGRSLPRCRSVRGAVRVGML